MEEEGNFTIKIVEIFELHARMLSAEYQTTVSLKFLLIIHNYWNGLDNQPIQITTLCSGSDVIGRHLRPVDSYVTEGVNDSKWCLEFRLTTVQMVQLSNRQFINVILWGRGGNLDIRVTVMKSIKIYFFATVLLFCL